MNDGTKAAAAAAGATDSNSQTTNGTDVPVAGTVGQDGIVLPPGQLDHPLIGGPKGDNLIPPGGGLGGASDS